MSNVYWLSIDAIALHSMLMVPMSSVSSRNCPYSSSVISPVTRSPFLSTMMSVLSRSACAGKTHSSSAAASSPPSGKVRFNVIAFLRRDSVRHDGRRVLTIGYPGVLSVDQGNLRDDSQVLHGVELALDLEEPRHSSGRKDLREALGVFLLQRDEVGFRVERLRE